MLQLNCALRSQSCVFIKCFTKNTNNLKTEKVLNVGNVHLLLYSWRAYFHSSYVHVSIFSPKVGRIKANTDHLTERMEYSVNQGKTWRLVPDTWPIASYNPILLRTRSGSRDHGNIKIMTLKLWEKYKRTRVKQMKIILCQQITIHLQWEWMGMWLSKRESDFESFE